MALQSLVPTPERVRRALTIFLSIVSIGIFSFAVSLGDSPDPDAGEREDIPLTHCEIDINPLNFSTGPPNERTGAPGEQTCVDFCHSTNALNTPGGTLTLTAPSEYLPGETINITIDRERAGQKRWGFEMTVLDAANNPVGVLVVVDPVRTQKSTAPSGREYLKHTSTGTDAGTNDVAPGWAVSWTAPAIGAGDVTFYVASNAANFDGSTLGDFIRTNSITVTEALDTDGDGLTDSQETAIGTNPGLADSDSDGVDDLTEVGDPGSPTDSDSDGTIDALDPDDDGDTVPTLVELANGDTDSDGVPDYLDTDDDGDGVETIDEDTGGNGDPTDDDTDTDGTPDYLDLDDDGDGIDTPDEDISGDGDPTNDNTDGDGLPNYLDDDDDGDGILTIDDACPLVPNPCPTTCCDTAGDADNSGSVTIGDVTFLISRIFSGGPAPDCCEEGDADGSGSINIGDVTYLIGRIFSGGPAPVCGPEGMLCGAN